MTRPLPLLLSAALLGALVACNGTAGSSVGSGGPLVTVRATFEKEVLTPTGPPTKIVLPARYCAVAFYDATSGSQVGDSGYLDANGTKTFQVPTGANVYAAVYADWSVPAVSGNSAFMSGFTVNAPYGTALTSSVPDWYVTSASFVADSSGTLNIRALDDASRIAGAFNIADQGVTFALGLRGTLPANTTMPTLGMYWSTSTNPANQARVYPNPVMNGSAISTLNGRGFFQAGVMGNASHAANTEQDEWDDGTLGETYAHLLFAPYSFKADGTSSLSYLRTDTENVPLISLSGPSEPSMAFTTGYCDFLSAAFRGQAQNFDSYWDGSGIFRVQNEDLSSPQSLGEFSRYGVAGSLWSMWQALGGSQATLQLLVNEAATTPSRPSLDGVGDYVGAPLGCFPTYLVGLRSDVGSTAAWNSCKLAFGQWGVADPTNLYFTGTSLWVNEPTPFSATGSLSIPASPAPGVVCYDKAGSALYSFVQGSVITRTITLTPSGQDMELDLLGPNGLDTFSYKIPFGAPRTIQIPALPIGSYVIRVRVNPDNTLTKTAGTYTYSLSLN